MVKMRALPLSALLVLLVGCVRLGFGDAPGHTSDGAPDGATADTRPADLAAPADQTAPADLVPAQDLGAPDMKAAPDAPATLGTWVATPLPASSSNAMHDVWVGPTATFVVGDSGHVFRDVGNGWVSIGPGPSSALQAVWGLPGGILFVAGDDSQVWRFSGGKWVQLTLPVTGIQINGAWGTAATDLWVVSNSTIWHTDGSSVFNAMPGCAGTSYLAVHGTSASNVWFAGGSGAICHYDGNSFSKSPHGLTTAALRAVWADPAGDVWFAGSNGTILRLTAGAVQAMQSGTLESLNGIWGSAPTDAY